MACDEGDQILLFRGSGSVKCRVSGIYAVKFRPGHQLSTSLQFVSLPFFFPIAQFLLASTFHLPLVCSLAYFFT